MHAKLVANTRVGMAHAAHDAMDFTTGGEVIPDSLALHATIPTQTAIKGFREHEILPITSIDDTGQIIFRFTVPHGEMMHVEETLLFVNSKIVDASTGKAIPTTITHNRDGDKVEILNPKARVLFANGVNHMWFKSLSVSVNGELIDKGNNNLYHVRGDLETRLGFGLNVKRSHLSNDGFIEEDTAINDHLSAADKPEEGVGFDKYADQKDVRHPELMSRFRETLNGKEYTTAGRIHSDFFQQPKLLEGGTTLLLVFERNSPALVLLSDNIDAKASDYIPRITKMCLRVKYVKVDQQICDDIEEMTYNGNNVHYPISRIKMQMIPKPNVGLDLSQPELLPGETTLPRRLFVVAVSQKAAMGDIHQDPFNYHHFDVKNVSLSIGSQVLPYVDCEVNFNTGDVLPYLINLLRATGTLYSQTDLGIDRYNYGIRNAIFGFTLTGSNTQPGECFEMVDTNSMALNFKLWSVPKEPINLIILAEYDSEITLNADGKAIVHQIP